MNSELTHEVIGAAIDVHKELGPGLLEKAYQRALKYELQLRQLDVEDEVFLPLQYKGRDLNCNYRVDLWVDRKLILEIKAVDKITDIHRAQLLSYLKMSNTKLGLILNFNTAQLKDGIERLILSH